MQMTPTDICRTLARNWRTKEVECRCSAIHHFALVTENLHCRCLSYILRVQQSIKVGHAVLNISRAEKIDRSLSTLSLLLLVQPTLYRGKHV